MQTSSNRNRFRAAYAAASRRRARHDEAIIQAEVNRLARAIQPFGIMRRAALQKAAGAEHWHQGTFDTALAAATNAGVLTALPLGFYGDPTRLTGRRVPDAAADEAPVSAAATTASRAGKGDGRTLPASPKAGDQT